MMKLIWNATWANQATNKDKTVKNKTVKNKTNKDKPDLPFRQVWPSSITFRLSAACPDTQNKLFALKRNPLVAG